MADENKPGREAPSGDESATPKPSSPKKADPVMTVSSWEGPLVNNLKARFGGQIKEFSVYLGQEFLIADLPATIPILDYLKTEQDFDYLVDITAVDYPEKAKTAVNEATFCALPPRYDPNLPESVDEMRGLRPAFDRAAE